MSQNQSMSKAKISELAKLKQKKFRLEKNLVVLEGHRLLSQLSDYGIKPLELFYQKERPTLWPRIPANQLTALQFSRICQTEHPADLAALFRLPASRKIKFHRALYLDQISDPGNLGTIFRTAAAFGVDCILLSEDSCEISNPKVIRASLGAVYQVPFCHLKIDELMVQKAALIAIDMAGEKTLGQYIPSDEAEIYVLGSEAHGIDPALLEHIDQRLRIPMRGKMESLNLAISAAIVCYEIWGGK